MKEKTKAHLVGVAFNIITILPIVFSVTWFVFNPHLEKFVLEIVRHESYALKYEWVSENLQTFRNIPEKTQWHKSEIKRLEERQKLLRDRLDETKTIRIQ